MEETPPRPVKHEDADATAGSGSPGLCSARNWWSIQGKYLCLLALVSYTVPNYLLL